MEPPERRSARLGSGWGYRDVLLGSWSAEIPEGWGKGRDERSRAPEQRDTPLGGGGNRGDELRGGAALSGAEVAGSWDPGLWRMRDQQSQAHTVPNSRGARISREGFPGRRNSE